MMAQVASFFAGVAGPFVPVSSLAAHDVSAPVKKAGPKPWRMKPAETADLGIALCELDGQSCKWPISEGPYTFCGGPVVDGRPYCQGHLRLAYRPVEKHRGSKTW